MAVTSYQDIKAMSANFRAMLNTHKATLPFDADNTAMVVLVDVATDLEQILMHNPAKLALIIGMENNRLTVCLLGADASGHPMKRTGPRSGEFSAGDFSGDFAIGSNPDDEELPGQETWPDDEEITNEENGEYDDFFP